MTGPGLTGGGTTGGGTTGTASAGWRPPMLATPSSLGAHQRTRGDRTWLAERKFDGLRTLAHRNGDEVTLWSRNHLPFTARFPSVVRALAALPADRFWLDGEVVTFDGERTSFARLQRGDGRPVYVVFDLVSLLGRDTTGLALIERRSLLHHLLGAQEPRGGPLRLSEVLAGDCADLLDRACREGWEGLLLKDADAPYRSGRSPAWRKLKCLASQELVVGGWTDPGGARTGLGSLLVGWYDPDGHLRYAGRVGTGFDESTLRSLRPRLDRLAVDETPFADAGRLRGVHWVCPELVAAVRFTEWTADGRLRHPSFLGLRDDKDPRQVTREDAGATPAAD